MFTLLRRFEFGIAFSWEERMLSVTSQLIQAVPTFVPVEWQLLGHFRCDRNNTQL